MAKARIPLPRNPAELLKLGQDIFNKHQEDGAASPLAGISAEWAEDGALLPEALEAHLEAEEHRRKAEAAFERRDNVVTKATPMVQRSRDILQGHYGTANLRKLGDHGFTVDDSPRGPKKF